MAYKGTYALNFPGEEVMCVMLGNEMTGFRKSGKQIEATWLFAMLPSVPIDFH